MSVHIIIICAIVLLVIKAFKDKDLIAMSTAWLVWFLWCLLVAGIL
jgi:hypothetical protein